MPPLVLRGGLGERIDGGEDFGFGEVVDEVAGADAGGEDEVDFSVFDFFVLEHGLVEVGGVYRTLDVGG